MLALIICWLSAMLILYTFGDFFVWLYNRISNNNEYYNIPSTFIIGMCGLMIPLGFSSLFIPSNQWVLLSLVFLSISYWCIRRQRLVEFVRSRKAEFQQLSKLHVCILLALVICIVLNSLLSSSITDASYYHYQNVRWNEEFAIVPGLANLESRFGFNSNYLLLNAVFSFRFLWGESLFLIQSLLLNIILIWFVNLALKHKRQIKLLVALLLFLVFYYTNVKEFYDSSTDAVPALITFYLLVYFILNPQKLKEQKLFAVFVPVALVSFKLSIAPLGIIGLYILYRCIVLEKFRTFCSLLMVCVLVITPWFIRNVIISGYLVYPLSFVDLFNVDWKVPGFIATIESDVIVEYARLVLRDILNLDEYFGLGLDKTLLLKYMRHRFLSDLSVILILITSIVAFVISVYKLFIKPVKVYAEYKVLFVAMLVCIAYWLVFAPDYRFISGVILGFIYLAGVLLIDGRELGTRYLAIRPTVVLALYLFIMTFMTVQRFRGFYFEVNNYAQYKRGMRGFVTLLELPYSTEAKLTEEVTYSPCMLGYITVYMTNDKSQNTYSKLPSTCYARKTPNAKHLPIEAIESRGESLQDGFRAKDDADKGWWNKPFDWEMRKEMKGAGR